MRTWARLLFSSLPPVTETGKCAHVKAGHTDTSSLHCSKMAIINMWQWGVEAEGSWNRCWGHRCPWLYIKACLRYPADWHDLGSVPAISLKCRPDVLPLQLPSQRCLTVRGCLSVRVSGRRNLTLFLSLMDPLPSTEILAPVSSCSLLIVLPWGPKIFPTKLNWEQKKETKHSSVTVKVGISLLPGDGVSDRSCGDCCAYCSLK